MKLIPQIRFKGFTDDWEERKLSEIGKIVTGNTPNTSNKDYYNGDFLFVSPADIQENRYVNKTTTTLTELGFKTGRLVPKGATLFVSIGSTIGKTGQSICDVITNQQINSVISFSDYDDDFIYTSILNSSTKIKQLAATQAVPIINKNEFGKSIIKIPSLEEQQKIGAFFKQLDDIIALHQRKLDLLKEQKKGYLQKMFPKNGAKVPELRFAGFADDWEERKFKDILKTHSFRSYLAGVSEDGEYEVIQQGDKPIVGYSDGEPFTDYKDITLFGDHTVSLYKPKSPFFVATDGVKILSADNFEGDYLYTTLERYKPEPQGYKRHFTILKNQDVWFTENMEEQQKIGVFFKQLDDTITLHQRKLDLLKEQKKGFLQKMF